jgi:hypothetical protein
VTPGGFGTPMFGSEEVVRLAGRHLLREQRPSAEARTGALPIDGSDLGSLMAFVEADLAVPFDAGQDTTDLGDLSRALELDGESTSLIADWFDLVVRVLDVFVAAAEPGTTSVPQLWPEHFDLSVDLAVGVGRANLGGSCGDQFHAQPYAYVGPWGPERPGGGHYWNAPFGAVLEYVDIAAADEPGELMRSFFAEGLDRLALSR